MCFTPLGPRVAPAIVVGSLCLVSDKKLVRPSARPICSTAFFRMRRLAWSCSLFGPDTLCTRPLFTLRNTDRGREPGSQLSGPWRWSSFSFSFCVNALIGRQPTRCVVCLTLSHWHDGFLFYCSLLRTLLAWPSCAASVGVDVGVVVDVDAGVGVALPSGSFALPAVSLFVCE